MEDDGILKERGAERSGYRGCLIGGVLFGIIGAIVTIYLTRDYAKAPNDMTAFMFNAMFGSVGFVVGGLVGCLLVFILDLLTRKKEREIDQF